MILLYLDITVKLYTSINVFMSDDDEIDWQKNVKPINCDKATFNIDNQINLKSTSHDRHNNINFSTSKENSLNTNNINLSFCLDHNTKSKIDKGKYFISDRLDLHGYNMDDAYHKLIDFVARNYHMRNRCLLVITGYGSATNKAETIKNNLCKWLSDTKIQHMVLYYRQATKDHGGKGAFYVLLRRNKNLKY